jgi:hypothetical protein
VQRRVAGGERERFTHARGPGEGVALAAVRRRREQVRVAQERRVLRGLRREGVGEGEGAGVVPGAPGGARV